MSIQSSLTPALANYPTTLTATIGIPNSYGLPTPTGTITFNDNGTPIPGQVTYTPSGTGYGSVSLQATLNYTFTTAGSHSVTASYSGDSTYSPATNQGVNLSVVDKAPTSIPYLNVYNVAANQPTNLSGDVDSDYINRGPSMTGTVTFLDGGTAMTGNVTLTSNPGYLIATLPYTFTTAGTHNITVQYSGDMHYAASQKDFAVKILGPLSVTLPSTSLIMSSSGGSTYFYPNVVNTTSGPLTVSLTCKPDIATATCSFSNPTVTVPANSTNGPQMTIIVPALHAALVRHHGSATIPFVFAGVLAGMSFATRKRRATLLAILAVLVIGLVSCGGGGGGSGGSPNPGNGGGGTVGSNVYHFTVTATSGSYTDSQTLTVTVQP
jgi:hypothetical protein